MIKLKILPELLKEEPTVANVVPPKEVEKVQEEK